MAEHLVYVISDLHLGGAPGGSAGERGFRMCTQGDTLAAFIAELAGQPSGGGAPRIELVINGDFVDFLAEEGEAEAPWTALKEDPEQARDLFLRIVKRNQAVFDALADLVRRGHTLTVLIGNHDIELAFPVVRQALAEVLGRGSPGGAVLRFLHDGEAYAIADALIEHGNRYDPFNAVDFDALRRVRSLQSRGQRVPDDLRLSAPPGSQLVAEVMNPLKQHYPFIDLLKPESSAAVPLLLALAPGARRHVGRLAALALKAREHRLRGPALPERLGDIAAVAPAPFAPDPYGDIAARGLPGDMVARGDGFGIPSYGSYGSYGSGGSGGSYTSGASDSGDAALREILGAELGAAEASRFLRELEPAAERPSGDISAPVEREFERGGDIAAPADPGLERGYFDGLRDKLGGGLAWARLLLTSDDALAEPRLDALHTALRAFCGPQVFDQDHEPPDSPYLRAAIEMAQGRFRHVIMGHTHLCRDIALPSGGRYLNTGTWADLMRMPVAALGDGAGGRTALRGLVEALRAKRLTDLVWRRPTYARLEIVGNKVTQASIRQYSGDHGPL